MGSEEQEECIRIIENEEEEKRANEEMWKYIFGFTEMAVLKCAVELGIPDVIQSHGRPMTVSELTSALVSDSELVKVDSRALARIMRFLSNRGIFRSSITHSDKDSSPKPSYGQTALSRRFMKSGTGDSMAALLLLESSPPMLSPWLGLATRITSGEKSAPPFEAVHGNDIWGYAAGDPSHSQLINDAMACDARVTMAAIAKECLDEVFGGVESVVDVGGGTGTAMGELVKACPRIRAINFDLPHVVAVAEKCDNVENVAGDFFEYVPKADATFLMWVLHDWSDEECVQILKKCREAIPKDKGKVIIVEAVIEIDKKKQDSEDIIKNNDNNKMKLKDVGLFLDMVMLAHTNTGKERTFDEWTYVLHEAGFCEPTVRSISAVQSVIEAFPAY